MVSLIVRGKYKCINLINHSHCDSLLTAVVSFLTTHMEPTGMLMC